MRCTWLLKLEEFWLLRWSVLMFKAGINSWLLWLISTSVLSRLYPISSY